MTAVEQQSTPILAAALDAIAAGLSVLPVRADGTKRPVGEWKKYQTQRATVEQVTQWFTGTGYGLGVICGAISGDLEMLELEGRFMDELGADGFRNAMRAAGLELLLQRLINGFMVVSPSGGRHFYYKVADAAAEPNTKLARRPATDTELVTSPDDKLRVLIETRGEGGFVVAPPSSGTVHSTGRAWATKAGSYAAVPTITAAEREAMFAVCRLFDTYGVTHASTVTPVAAQHRVIVERTSNVRGTSWMDTVVDHLRHTIPMSALLEHYGWAHAYTDAHGRQLMTRPGKDDGVSGSINLRDRLMPFSTAVPFATGGAQPSTFDQLDVIAAYEHAGDRMAAARSVAERTGILDAWKATQPAQRPTNVDPETGEIIADETDQASNAPALDEEFWKARPYLAHIHDAAHRRMVAPAAVLGCLLARVSAFTPPSLRLPPIIGTDQYLSTYVALRARSGGGKSSATGCAADLLPDVPPGCVGPLPLGSGEGMIDAFFDMVDDVDGGGKKTRMKKKTRHGVLFNLDEGQALAEMGARKGSTILPILRTAWSGSTLGQANASVETRRTMEAGTYAVGLVSLWQDQAAAKLIEDADGGTPQRFVFIDTIDATITADQEWRPQIEPLAWKPPAAIVRNGVHQAEYLDVDPAIVHEIRHAHAATQRGEADRDPLDSHRNLVKLKLAGVLAVLDGRLFVDLDDWRLAECLVTHSDGVRAWIVAEAARGRRDADLWAIQRHVSRESAVEDSAQQRAMQQATKAVYRATVKAADGRITKREASRAMSSKCRLALTVDDVMAEAERLNWLQKLTESDWGVGDAKPA
jgi:hypothetical protein